ncbi:hypothetical protein SUDANB95_05361 [Actinosynnema sp. ALI-1.44]
MKRVAVFAALLALLAVFTPSPTGPVHHVVAGLQPVTALPAPSEEDPNRECRSAPEPRTCASSGHRPGAAQRPTPPDRVPTGRTPVHAARPAPRADAPDHLHTRLTPPVLQVFRN